MQPLTEIPKLKFANVNAGLDLKMKFDVQQLYEHIENAVFYDSFPSCVSFYFDLNEDSTIGDLIFRPSDARKGRGTRVYARIFNTGKLRIMGKVSAANRIVLVEKLIHIICNTERKDQPGEYAFPEYREALKDFEVHEGDVQVQLFVAHCSYPLCLDISKLAKLVEGTNMRELFSGMSSRRVTAHVNLDKQKTQITIRGDTMEKCIEIHGLIFNEHEHMLSEERVSTGGDAMVQSLIDGLIPNMEEHKDSVLRCGFEKKNGDHCANHVKGHGKLCWRHASKE